jgi:hypothetical protein
MQNGPLHYGHQIVVGSRFQSLQLAAALCITDSPRPLEIGGSGQFLLTDRTIAEEGRQTALLQENTAEQTEQAHSFKQFCAAHHFVLPMAN